ncbi:MAG: hypothetical protein H6985_03990 [Pseudomonadales bacterium]|nr:hypothetical protein [Pseudomonadales bacterium]
MDSRAASHNREAPPSSPAGALLGLGGIYFMLFLAYSLWRATLHNNAVENFGLGGDHIGYLFSLNYLPGVFCFLIGMVATRLQLYRLVVSSCTLLSAGLVLASLAHGFPGLAAGALLVALGFTVFYTTASALCLASGPDNAVASALGRMKSLGPLSGLAAAVVIIWVFAPEQAREVISALGSTDSVDSVRLALQLFAEQPRIDFEKLDTLLVIMAFLLILAGLLFGRTLAQRAEGGSYGRLRIRRELAVYYALNFLAGCRSAIFQAFALFVMVKEFHLPVHATAALVLAGNICSFLGYRCIGRAVVRFQCRAVLTVIYFLVMCNFLGFWFVLGWSGFGPGGTLLALCGLFLIDSLLFGVSVVTDSYLRITGEFSSYVGDIGAGMTCFSIAAVVMSMIGGALWGPLQHNAFLLGAVVCVLAMIAGRGLHSRTAAAPAM